MSNEITIQRSLTVRKGNLPYTSPGSQARADMAGSRGPSPGGFLATEAGVDIDLSGLVSPGMCAVLNTDGANSVQYGLRIGSSFYVEQVWLPGEPYLWRWDPDVGLELAVGGTGSVAGVAVPHVRGVGGDCWVIVDSFDT